ncbi:MAG: hypothetical protein ABIK85_03010 [Candidatus Eisenbacteria bacterium]
MKKRIGVVLWLALAAWTLIPVDASKPCALGYEGHCTFTPFSTLILLIVAWLSFWWSRRKIAKAA